MREAAGDAKTARAGFVGYFQFCVGMSFVDAAQSLLQSMEVIGDGAEEADLALGTGLSDGNGDGVLMDIETEMKCNR